MKKISIDELIDMVDSRYSLVTIISRRARQIIDGQDILVRTPTLKPVCVAIEEFYEGAYEAIYNIDQQGMITNDEETAIVENLESEKQEGTEE